MVVIKSVQTYYQKDIVVVDDKGCKIGNFSNFNLVSFFIRRQHMRTLELCACEDDARGEEDNTTSLENRADELSISNSDVSFPKIFTTWIDLLNVELPMIFPFPIQENVLDTMPISFYLYPFTRVIIDCTEVFVEIPSSMLAQSQTWFNYKHHNTYTVTVGVCPTSNVTVYSEFSVGGVSGKEVTKHSCLLDLPQP
ncbi:unnamed protein product [Mytilus coruscus]|uniref:DDE Tnp4 domain-containing protein n=1 Tax=Mytilus coruscus TaxID=42192 RepID=A0A6J8E9E3_MYTCO|nr:unnamed protein product [Mytilus coruscus]